MNTERYVKKLADQTWWPDRECVALGLLGNADAVERSCDGDSVTAWLVLGREATARGVGPWVPGKYDDMVGCCSRTVERAATTAGVCVSLVSAIPNAGDGKNRESPTSTKGK